jgi:hypothetical protein
MRWHTIPAWMLLAAMLLAACQAQPPSQPEGSLAERLRTAAEKLDDALTSVGAGDLAKAREAYEAFEQGWDRVDDDVKDRSTSAYEAIREAAEEARERLAETEKPDAARAREVLDRLREVVDENLPRLR